MQDADKEDALLVSITRDGKVYFGTEQITTDNLTTKVKDRLANKQDKRVYVKADMRTRFGGVVQVVDSVRAAGVDDLGLLTDQRKTAPAPRRLQLRRRRANRGERPWEWQLARAEAKVQISTSRRSLTCLLVLLIIFMVISPVTPKGLDALVPQPPPPNAPKNVTP